jgi:ATP-dependent DNA helicase RecG
MDKKGHYPHMLAMTATPIPRSMAITLYGDMDISMIREYPEGHTPVATHLVDDTQKRWLFDTIKERMSAGQQVFVICPVIEGSEDIDIKSAEDMGKRLKKILSPPFRVEIIHGRLSMDKKDQIMRDFHKGLIHLLVGTTVIEVGIHAPNATVMIIEHPERFGLAQIHQLRGRVGRGTQGGICALMLRPDLTEKSLSRLGLLAGSHDGFEIASKDLELRGHGELTGVKQAGSGELDLSEIMDHQELFNNAKREAWDLIKSDHDLFHPDHRYLRIIMEKITESPMDV